VTIYIMAAIGVAVGLVFDEVVARLARAPFERDDEDDGGDTVDDTPAHRPAALELASETGAIALPRSLTTAAMYRRIIVVGVTAGIFAAIGARWHDHIAEIPIVAAYASVLIVCAATDIIAYRVPNVVSYPAILGALIIGVVLPGASRIDVIAGGLFAGGLFLAFALLPGGPMGMGDVKLALFIGLALGLIPVVQAMLIMAVAGGIVALPLLVLKVLRVRSATYMFYAPFISIGAIVVMLFAGTAFRAL